MLILGTYFGSLIQLRYKKKPNAQPKPKTQTSTVITAVQNLFVWDSWIDIAEKVLSK